MVELARAAGSAHQGVEVDGHCDMRTFTGNDRAVRTMEPLTAHLAQGVRASLRRGSGVLRVPSARFCVQDGPQRCHERFAGIWIQIAIDPNHPSEHWRDVEPSSVPSTLCLVRRGINSLLPIGHDLLQLSHTVVGGGLQEDRLVITEHVRVSVVGGGE
jgi:hypothetical protein